MYKIINTKKQKGFTLIETLIAIMFLLISITAPLSAASNGLAASFFARDQIVAFYLAQDVVETIKYLRDNHVLTNGSGTWLNGLGGCRTTAVGTTTRCRINTSARPLTSTALVSCLAPSCNGQLYYNTTTRRYTHDITAITSKYQRVAYVTEIVDNKEAQIIVEVSWNSNVFSTRKVVIQENIYNWVSTYVK
jgi:prepilin-type N-terminal cleavage/methylation domain-containing protein